MNCAPTISYRPEGRIPPLDLLMPLRLVQSLRLQALAILRDDRVLARIIERVLEAGPAPFVGIGGLVETGDRQLEPIARHHPVGITQLRARLAQIEEDGAVVRSGPMLPGHGVGLPLVPQHAAIARTNCSSV